jgi:hypothetical protein
MPRVAKVLTLRVSRESVDGLIGQVACYAAGVLVLILGLTALPRFATTRFELFVGTIAVSTLAMVCVLMGLVLGVLMARSHPGD